jgi:riboflavin kinase/FMN adenylyltransferase
MNAALFSELTDLPRLEEAYVTVGNFDGLHKGHRKIIDAMQRDAGTLPTIAVTFEEATSLYLKPGIFKGYLFPDNYKRKALAAMGMKIIMSLSFDRIAGMEAGEFIRVLKNRIKFLHFYVGKDFRFGRGNTGSVHMLRKLARDKLLTVKVIEKMKWHFLTISSSAIREKIINGRMQEAADMLGRPYFITSRKIKGDGIGAQNGYPTINLEINRQVLPQNGVYFTFFNLGDKCLPSMTYIGNRPSMKSHEKRNETNIVDAGGNLGGIKNGNEYTVLYIKKIRNEKKFNNLDELRENLYNDRKRVLELYSRYRIKWKIDEIFLPD